jgi:cell division protein FtsI/penicillin-binding protein 2
MPQKNAWVRYPQSDEPREREPAAEWPSPAAGEDATMLARRVRPLAGVFAFLILVIIVRLATVQIFAAPLPTRSAGESTNPSRGRVVDRSSLLLATDVHLWEVYAAPPQIQTPADVKLITTVAQILGRSDQPLLATLSAHSKLPTVTLAKDATEEQCAAIMALKQTRRVWCTARLGRIYPQGSLATHLVGFANYEQIGVYGVEESYNPWLRAAGDWSPARLPGEPRPAPQAWKLYLPSPAGRDVALHLDAPLQYAIEQRLAEAIAKYQAEAGTIIVMDPRTGGILALANWPTFDLNAYSEAPKESWVDAAVGQIYEPGSVFKLITMAAALDSGQVTPDKLYRDEGVLKVSNREIRNAERKTYGDITVREALARSVNVVTARICLDMGAETFYRYVRQFGFGKLTEVDLHFEGYGIVKEPGNPNWSYFDQATNSFGQGISVSSLQMIRAVAAIANKGVLLQPQVVKELIFNGQLYGLPPRVMGYPIKPETAQALTQMMVYTVDRSAYPLMTPGYRIAGKTGTAEIPTDTGYSALDTITSFVGFLPAADPQIVILVKLVKPTTSRWAEHVAQPVFGLVAQDAVRILRIPPDDRMP